ALRARGPARYYGGELEAARMLIRLLDDDGFSGVQASVADGVFTAEQAARTAGVDEPVRVVAPGEAGAFLAPLSIATLDDDEFGSLLSRLGVHTLGDLAGLPIERMRERFGERGVRLHALAGGLDSQPVHPRTPPPELHRDVAFEPPLELADQIAFGMRVAAEEFIARLGAHDLVCTELRVVLTGERGERSERVWLHPGSFDAAGVSTACG
ncbi:nucleotidyltransferase, partial [Microbacterium sp. SUBG005]